MAEIKDANGSPPAGYHKLPDGVRCRCMRLWRSASGDHYCCRPKASDPTGADPAGVASEAVERLTLAAERAEAKDAFHAATADAGDLRFLLSDYKARGEEIERLRGEAVTASICIDKLARERDAARATLTAKEDTDHG